MASSLMAYLQKKVRKKIARSRKKQLKKEKRTSDNTWRLVSDEKPRWNAEGTTEVGGDRKPPEALVKIEENRKSLGDPPSDLRIER